VGRGPEGLSACKRHYITPSSGRAMTAEAIPERLTSPSTAVQKTGSGRSAHRKINDPKRH
jgi:hypothetical protein